MVSVLIDFGFGYLGLQEEDFLKENFVTQLGYPILRIDILNAISGIEFDEAYQNKAETDIDDLKVNFINIKEFVQNKIATGRTKDIGDTESLNSNHI